MRRGSTASPAAGAATDPGSGPAKADAGICSQWWSDIIHSLHSRSCIPWDGGTSQPAPQPEAQGGALAGEELYFNSRPRRPLLFVCSGFDPVISGLNDSQDRTHSGVSCFCEGLGSGFNFSDSADSP